MNIRVVSEHVHAVFLIAVIARYTLLPDDYKSCRTWSVGVVLFSQATMTYDIYSSLHFHYKQL